MWTPALRTVHGNPTLSCRPRALRVLPAAVLWLLKLVAVFLHMCALMLGATVRAGRPQLMLIQSPPALPVLAACALARYCYGTATIIDFHNLAYTLMRPLPPPDSDRSELGPQDSFAARPSPPLCHSLACVKASPVLQGQRRRGAAQ